MAQREELDITQEFYPYFVQCDNDLSFRNIVLTKNGNVIYCTNVTCGIENKLRTGHSKGNIYSISKDTNKKNDNKDTFYSNRYNISFNEIKILQLKTLTPIKYYGKSINNS